MANDIIKLEIINSDESKKVMKDREKVYRKLEKAKETIVAGVGGQPEPANTSQEQADSGETG
jgi:hypothetical protein